MKYFYFTLLFTLEPYNSCLEDLNEFKGNKTLINHIKGLNETYEQNECMIWCKIIKYLETQTCNCSLKKLSDQRELIENCLLETQSTRLCTANFVDHFKDDCTEYCPNLCSSVEYDISFYTEYIPNFGEIKNGSFFDEFKNYENISKNYLQISVYFEDLKYILIDQKPKMEPFDLVSNIGNVFGLFLGMGLLSFIEIIEIMIEFFIYIAFN